MERDRQAKRKIDKKESEFKSKHSETNKHAKAGQKAQLRFFNMRTRHYTLKLSI